MLGAHPMKYAAIMKYKQSAEQFFKQGDFNDAEKLFLSALEESRSYQPANEYTARQLKTMGVFYLSLEAYTHAETYLLEALRLERGLLSPDSSTLVDTINMVGLLYHLWGHYTEAESMYMQAYQLEQKARYARYPQNHSNLTYRTQHHLAMLLCAKGERLEALHKCTKNCSKMIANMGPSGHNLYTELHKLAIQYCGQKQYEEADKISKWILELELEQLQKEYLNCTLAEALKNRKEKSQSLWFSPQYEFLAPVDEPWRPSDLYRPSQRKSAIATNTANRLALEVSDSWRPHPFTLKN
jgi:tetratricopeptide (TPR) repeat protein